MRQRRSILTAGLAALALLAGSSSLAQADRARIAAAAQHSQRFESILGARIAVSRTQSAPTETTHAPRAPRLLHALRMQIAGALRPALLLDANADLEFLQRRGPGRRPHLLAALPLLPTPLFAPLRPGRILDGRRPSEPE